MKVTRKLQNAMIQIVVSASQAVLSEARMMETAKAVYRDWKEYHRDWLIFRVTEYADGSQPYLATVATFPHAGHGLGSRALMLCRAEASMSVGRILKDTHRLMLQVKHQTYDAIVWIDAETGEIWKTRPWRKHVDGEEVPDIDPADFGKELIAWLLSLEKGGRGA